MLQVTIESLLAICAHVVSRQGLRLPKTHVESVDLGAEDGLIPLDMLDAFKNTARFAIGWFTYMMMLMSRKYGLLSGII